MSMCVSPIEVHFDIHGLMRLFLIWMLPVKIVEYFLILVKEKQSVTRAYNCIT